MEKAFRVVFFFRFQDREIFVFKGLAALFVDVEGEVEELIAFVGGGNGAYDVGKFFLGGGGDFGALGEVLVDTVGGEVKVSLFGGISAITG